MSRMFVHCKSLTNLNLSDFNTQNVNNMTWMFENCVSLKKENIIIKDNSILANFHTDLIINANHIAFS